MEGLEQAFEKAAEGLAQTPAPEGQAVEAPKPAANQPSGQAEPVQEAPKESAPEGQAEKEWDGKPESLPNELKQDPKAIQRAYTRIAMAKAEAEKKLKEYEGLNKQDIEAYRQWKAEQVKQTAQQPVMPTQLTPDQLEVIKNDPQALTAYVQTLVNNQLQQAAQVVGQELAQVKHAQSVAEWERTIADFGEVHPDMWEMHQAGLFKPILEATVKAGGTLEDAYSQAAKIRDAFRVQAKVEAQTRVKEKKNATSFPGNNSSETEVFYVDNKKEAMDKAFDLAYQGKKGKVKIKK